MSDQGTAPPRTEDMAEWAALRQEFWRRVPNWVPRKKFTTPTPGMMRDVEAGLRRLL